MKRSAITTEENSNEMERSTAMSWYVFWSAGSDRGRPRLIVSEYGFIAKDAIKAPAEVLKAKEGGAKYRGLASILILLIMHVELEMPWDPEDSYSYLKRHSIGLRIS